MIPKRISFFWSGPLSWMRYMTLASFRQHNPEWEIRVYTPDSQPSPGQWSTGHLDDRDYSGRDFWPELSKLSLTVYSYTLPLPDLAAAQQSDLFQWDLLATAGGFYADMDILWLRPLDYNGMCGFDACFCLEDGRMAIGFFGAVPGCRVFADIRAEALLGNRTGYQSFGTDAVYRMAKLPSNLSKSNQPGIHAVEAIQQHYPELNIAVLPDELVYPFDWRQIREIFDVTHSVPPGTAGLHWFGGSAIAQEWNETLTPGSIDQTASTWSVAYARFCHAPAS